MPKPRVGFWSDLGREGTGRREGRWKERKEGSYSSIHPPMTLCICLVRTWAFAQFQRYCNIYRRQHTIQASQWVLKVNVLLVGVCGCMWQRRTLWSLSSPPFSLWDLKIKVRFSGCIVWRQRPLPAESSHGSSKPRIRTCQHHRSNCQGPASVTLHLPPQIQIDFAF